MTNPRLKDGFVEIPHRADLALQVWSCHRMGIFLQSAMGLYALMGIEKTPELKESRHIELEGSDDETLLINFLNELIVDAVLRKVAYEDFRIHVNNFHLEGELNGVKIKSYTREIKAATYHEIKIKRTRLGFETKIVFDV